MEEHTKYSLDKDWSMQSVVPYLLKYYFKEKPTSKKDLVEVFHKLMGKGKYRWTEKGVPIYIAKLATDERKILGIHSNANNKANSIADVHYVLGKNAEKYINEFISACKNRRIDIKKEIETYLGKTTEKENPSVTIDEENNNDKKTESNHKDSDIYKFFNSKELYFPEEILSRYFLSLKTKPFVILTGISGTGKTKIAQIFADYLLKEIKNEKEKHKAFIPVRPDWMDNKGLLGFYNILDQKYHSTKFLEIILEAKKNTNEPYFIILDEMNLSKVEMYFSDFLSIMETRTLDDVKGETINLHSQSPVHSVEGNEIRSKIHIPQNVFITGTVNVDETTYMFSPKVLDRANVIEFNEVDLETYAGEKANKTESFYIPQDLTKELITPESEKEPFCSKKDYMELRKKEPENYKALNELLNILKEFNLHFGYRVVNEISRFICLAKEYIGKQFDFDAAFDIQILQKILPKFHGTQAKLEQPLKEILRFCYENRQIDNIEDTIEKAVRYDNGSNYPRSAQKVARMILNLRAQGYTSFIE